MAEYIDREALYEKAYWHGEHPDVGNPFPDGVDAIDIKDVDAIPATDVAPVVHGRWVDGRCSNCGVDIPTDDAHDVIFGSECRFCYYCGAKMDGGDSDEAD